MRIKRMATKIKKQNINLSKGFFRTLTLASLLCVFKKSYLIRLFSRKSLFFCNIRAKQQNTTPKLVCGFSLVEMLVAIAVFMSIMTIAITSLISIIGANKKAQSIKSTIDSVNFAVESISRDMRTGTDYECPDGSGGWTKSCDLVNGNTAVRYEKSPSEDITYTFNGEQSDPSIGVLTKQINSGVPVDLISQDSSVNITDMKFYVIGAENEFNSTITDRTQPRVIITASGLISVNGMNDTLFNLQTNISQRTRR